MISKNIILTSTPIVLLVVMLGVITFQPHAAAALVTNEGAVVESEGAGVCPIVSGPRATFVNNGSTVNVENAFSGEVRLSNDTTYTFGGVKVAVAVFGPSSSEVPSYWSVLPGEYLLLPKAPLTIYPELDLSILPAGQYKVKAFAMQGDETALLGAVLRDANKTEGVTMVKSSAAKKEVSVTVAVNGKSYTKTPIALADKNSVGVVIVTKNDSALPVVSNKMLAVVTGGSVPLGSAVQADKQDSVQLIPGGSRTTKLTSGYLEGGMYTVYAALVSSDALSPVVAVPIDASESSHEGSWSYISKIGLTEYPLRANSEIVTCVNNIGLNEGREVLSEPWGVKLVLKDQAGVAFNAEQNSVEAKSGNYFIFRSGKSLADFTLTADLLRQRFSPEVAVSETTGIDPEGIEFYTVDTTSQTFTCVEGDMCTREVVVTETNTAPQDTPYKPYWFYLGVMAAAALLLYIMLRRLPPEERDVTKDFSEEELK